ncbi:MAG: V-type ATP synthase subunit F [Dehalococcoidales bacterium]
MADIKQRGIAVIGDEDLVNGMRLAGIDNYHIIADTDNAEEVRKALGEVLAETYVAIIVLQEDCARHAEDLITRSQEKSGTAPVVIEVPSKFGTQYEDVSQYYKSYIRKSIGFDIEI